MLEQWTGNLASSMKAKLLFVDGFRDIDARFRRLRYQLRLDRRATDNILQFFFGGVPVIGPDGFS